MKQYQDLQKHILAKGITKKDRTGTGTLSVFGYQMRFDLSEGFPLLTTKDMSGVRFKGIVEELLWMLDADTDVKTLVDKGVNIWTPDAYRDYKKHGGKLDKEEFKELVKEEGYCLGPIYGHQFRSWTGRDHNVDQIANVINSIKNDPDSRRHIVSAWNVADVPYMALPPCHILFQFYVADGKLSCQLYQRSADVFLGAPYNIASYALLTHMIAQQTGLEVGEFIHTLGDAHVYINHIDQTKLQLSREPKELPTLHIKRKPKSIFDYDYDDFELIGYNPHPPIKAEVSVG